MMARRWRELLGAPLRWARDIEPYETDAEFMRSAAPLLPAGAVAEAGWYPDWNGELRWWDGVWTERVAGRDLAAALDQLGAVWSPDFGAYAVGELPASAVRCALCQLAPCACPGC